MKKIISAISLGILSALVSCNVEGLMEKQDTDPNSPDKVFGDKDKVRQALTHLYGSVWFTTSNGGFNLFNDGGNAFLETATDNAVTPSEKDPAKVFTMGTLTAASTPFFQSNPWSIYYQAIRSANVFMANIDRSPLPDDEKTLMKEEARLLRAIYYHEMFRLYGALVIIGDEIVDGMTTSLVRSSLEDTVTYIVDEFEAVIDNGILPEYKWAENGDHGRATLGMAYAYKARTLLYAASPLNSPDQPAAKWAAAVDAAKDLINKNWYSLHYDATTPGLSFARFFNERTSGEQILSFLRAPTQDLYRNLPPGAPWNTVTSWAGTAVTMNAVDAFAMKDGKKPITGYNSDGSPIIVSGTGYDDTKPFDNRDPRLDMTVLHQGSKWTVNRTVVTLDVNAHTANNSLAITNICLRKFLDDRIDHWGGATTNINVPMMRYAEVLLNYAEAKNESSASLSAEESEEIVGFINDIRIRAGADALSPTGWTQQTLREQIKMERRMEFMLEGHWFYDVRRWKEGGKYFDGAIYGMDVVNENIVRKRVQERVFLDRQYRLPIPTRDVSGSSGRIWQNTGW